MSDKPETNIFFNVVNEGLCRSCGEELKTAHKLIGVCSFCVSSKKRKLFPQVKYGVQSGG